jgi:hypothetical protein
MWRQVAVNGEDPYAIDPSLIPDGWIYEWKRYSIYNQVQASYQTSLQRVGKWTPVLKESHDGIFDAPGIKGTIIHEGLVLMAQPKVLNDEAVADEKRAANMAVHRAKTERGLTPANAGTPATPLAARPAMSRLCPPPTRRRARTTGGGAGPDLHGRVTDSDFTATPRRRRAHSTGRGGAPPGPAWTDDSDDGPADRQGPAGPTRSGARRGVSRARPDRAGQLADYPLLTA